MNRFSGFPLRWLLFIGLFILAFSLTIQHIVNGQGDGEEGFRLRLSEGRKNALPEPTPTIAAPPSSTLPDDATQNLLKRLPAIAGDASDRKEFAVRERSLPPRAQVASSTNPFHQPQSVARQSIPPPDRSRFFDLRPKARSRRRRI